MPDNKELIKTDKDQESINNIKKLSKLDKEIVAIIKDNPNTSYYEVGKLLVDRGKSQITRSVYNRLKYSDYLTAEIDKIHTHNAETLARKAVPKASKVLINIVKDKSIPDVDKLPAVNTILKHGLKQDVVSQAPRTVSIEQVNINQQIVRDNVADDDVVEGEVVDD